MGYSYQPQTNNNIGLTNMNRNLLTSSKGAFLQYQPKPALMRGNLEGTGFMDIVRDIHYSGQKVLSDVRNIIPDSDDTARKGFPGERHAILQLKNKLPGIANYMGPGTQLIKRLERGDPPRSEVDKVAIGHDIRYGLAKTIGDVRRADNIMIHKVNQIAKKKADSPWNIAQARLIKAKTIGEDLGLIKKDAFTGDLANNDKISSRDKSLMVSKLHKLEQEGYGLNPTGGSRVLPGDALKLKVLKQLAKSKKQKGGSMSMSRDLGKGYKLKGSGCGMMGKGAITDFVVDTILPSLLKSIGIKEIIPLNQLKSIIGKSLDMVKTGNLPQIVNHLTKTLLTILTHLKVKTMSGKGKRLNLTGRGVSDILGDAKGSLMKLLSDGLFNAFKWYLNNLAKAEGRKPPFSGSGSAWDDFWAGFAKGFKMVFKPGAKILSGIASILGHPEIGTALGIASDLL